MYTNGKILKIEPQKLLQHSLLGEDSATISTITYTFDENAGQTALRACEDYVVPASEQEYDDALEGWNAALEQIKVLAEKSA